METQSFTRRRLLSSSIGLACITLAMACQAAGQPGADQRKTLPRIGFIKQPPLLNYVDAFKGGMSELGYVENQRFILDYRYVEDATRLPTVAAELVNLPVDILVCPNASAADAARKATSTIPIIFVTLANPLADGWVESLARPGANLTGPSQLAPGVTGKRLQLLREMKPGIQRIGVLWNPGVQNSVDQWVETQEAARVLGLDILSLEVREPNDFTAAFASALAYPIDALFMPITQVVMVQQPMIAQFALANRLPAMTFQREFPDAGGLMSYGVSISYLYRRAAYYVDKILNGAIPATLPVEQPTEFDLIVNRSTAQAFGITIPSSIASQATEIVG